MVVVTYRDAVVEDDIYIGLHPVFSLVSGVLPDDSWLVGCFCLPLHHQRPHCPTVHVVVKLQAVYIRLP